MHASPQTTTVNKWKSRTQLDTVPVGPSQSTGLKRPASTANLSRTSHSGDSSRLQGTIQAFMKAQRESRISAADLKSLLSTSDSQSNNTKLAEAVNSLLLQCHDMEMKSRSDVFHHNSVTYQSQASQRDASELKHVRDSFVCQQEELRTEILELADRLKKLEQFCDVTLNPDTSGKFLKRKKEILKMNPGYKNIDNTLVELGLKEKITPTLHVQRNDQAVRNTNAEMLIEQSRCIDELNKYELLLLKKPKYTLLMDKILEVREPNESTELKLLKKVLRSINYLYAKINEVDLEVKNHRQSFGSRSKELREDVRVLEDKIRQVKDDINRANAYQAFKDADLEHIKAKDFLESNPVPFNFSKVLKDYKLLDVFGVIQK